MSRVQSIERAFAVLGALADGPIGVTEVAERARLPKSTAARLLASLAREGVVEQVPGDTRYRLGGRLATLAAGVLPDAFAGPARPAVARRAGRRGRRGGRAVRAGRRPRPLRRAGRHAQPGVGPRLDRARACRCTRSRPARCCWPSGQPAALERYLARTAGALHGADPGRRRTRCASRLREVRRDGYAWAREEFDEGISSVAAPIADASGEVVAAVHLHGPSYRFPVDGAEAAVAERGRDGGGADRREPAPGLAARPPRRGPPAGGALPGSCGPPAISSAGSICGRRARLGSLDPLRSASARRTGPGRGRTRSP